MSVSFSLVPHAVFILAYVDSSSEPTLQFFLFPFERPLKRVLLYCTSSPLFTLLTFALERISLSILSIPIIRTPH